MKHLPARRKAIKQLGGLGVSAMAVGAVPAFASSAEKGSLRAQLDLSTPEKRAEITTKIMGSTGEEEKHTFLRFHIYGYMGENVVPFFSMNNYVVQYWKPDSKPGHYHLKHYETGYYTEFDTDKPITQWTNPVSGEKIDLETFILGPIGRLYTPEGIIAPGIAPQPLRVNVIGDRVYVPTQSIEAFPNMFQPGEWPEYSSGEKVFWDSMSTYSAPLSEVLDPSRKSVKAEIHMQNLTSWQPFLRLGQLEGRSMARAFGQHINGFSDLSDDVYAGFKKYTPDIFDTANWQDVRFDSIDFYNKALAEKKASS
ncbi:DUF1838 family protein [Alteromonas sp. NFXS44]|uniref:DUF1838 family protein n=1 Tax=Alteromonas sp. NFXS44 TaxID=2818435 RepID=UPI0032DE7CE4